jgi:predicted transposase YbfD/YdcC
MPCTVKKTSRDRSSSQRRLDRRGQGQPADPAPASPRGLRNYCATRVCPQPRQGSQPREQRKLLPRDERRTVTVFDPADSLADTDWHPHVATIIRVEREIYTRSAKTGLLRHSTETAFYVSNTPVTAVRAAEAIRAHWRIENTSHYSRDVTLGEDRSRIRTNPGVFARLRSFAFNILKANRTDTLSQDRYRAGLAGIKNLLSLTAIRKR